MFRPAVIAAGCLAAVFTLSVAAQQPQPGQNPVFRSTVDLVHLDVSVLDKDRRPVRGLTDKDFTITEDDKLQDIVAFSAVDVPDNPPKPAAWSGRAPVDVQSNEGAADPEGRLFVLLIDDALIPPDSKTLETARKVSKQFLDRITPHDRVAVVFSSSGRNQNFTSDRAKLEAAIDSLKVGHARHLGGWETARDPNPGMGLVDASPVGPANDPDIMFRQASMQTLRGVAETLISLPQRRKALVFISPGIAIDVTSSAAPVSSRPLIDMVTPAQVAAGTVGGQGGMIIAQANPELPPDPRSMAAQMALIDSNRQLAQDLPELFLRMGRANVTIYPVDPCGSDGFRNYVMAAAATVPLLHMLNNQPASVIATTGGAGQQPPPLSPLAANFNFLYPGGGVPNPVELSSYMSTLSMDFLETAAANTGGRPIVKTNDFEDGLDKLFDENSSYYLLGYSQPPGQTPGSLHKIKVKVNRADVFVRTRSGYATPEAPKAKKKNANAYVEPPSPLDTAIVNAVPEGALPMRVALAPFVMPGKKDPMITIALGLTQPQVKQRSVYAVDLQTNAYTYDGRPKFIGRRYTALVTLVPTGDKDLARYDVLTSISLPPGQYQLRLSAFRAADGVSGSLYADLDVPDFTAPISVSGVVVEAVPMSATAPIGAFDNILPVVPTTNREFTRDQDVTAFMRIYQGGTGSAKPVEVRSRIVNENDAPVGTAKNIVYGTDFRVGGRAADYRFAIPVKNLPPGMYLATWDFDLDGTVVHRSVQFKVKK